MAKTSAGILLYRWVDTRLQVFLVHPGGPYWAHKDAAAWSIPKGELSADEDSLQAARREFREETGLTVDGPYTPLGTATQPGGKKVTAWAVAGDCDAGNIRSNAFELEWPPRSGRMQQFPEIDRADWFALDVASEKILPGQRPLLEALVTAIPAPS